MKKTTAIIGIMLMAALFLAACTNQPTYYPAADDYVSATEDEIELEVEYESDPAQEYEPAEADASDVSEEDTSLEDAQANDQPYTTPPSMEISEYGRQVAEEFISTLTTVFTGVLHAETIWDSESGVTSPTGRYILGWDNETFEMITTYDRPEISFAPSDTGEWGFFDRQGNPIHDAPWLYAQHWIEWSSVHYAGSFRLFDFDNDGIPEIFVHFNQTFDGGYAGFYRIFRYIDGEYRMLEMKSVSNGVEPWAWVGRSHDLFVDGYGRIITFLNSDYHGIYQYEQLVLTDEHAELHWVAGMMPDEWEIWNAYHWGEWGEIDGNWSMVDGWLFHNPTIFGTDIPLTPIQSLVDLEDEIRASIIPNF
ncbi:MAG: hypothetical protein FWD03_07985 [Defluviitaleaceae bacterium]|nr:hypothetical protein [Defluviitaleaceae bacterium]